MRAEGAPPSRAFATACWVLVATGLVLQAAGVLQRGVHGDEFIFLGRVHALEQGRAFPLLQTAYAWLFRWLPWMGVNEVDQVQGGRWALLALWPVTLFLLYRVARHVTDARGALAAVALAAVLRDDVIHAASFRVDGLLAPVFLGACLAALRPTLVRVGWAGGLSALLLVLSIKSVLLLPVVAAVLWVAATTAGPGPAAPTLPPVKALGLWTLKLVLTTAFLLVLHGVLRPDGAAAVAGGPPDTPTFLRNAGFRMLVEGGILPRLGTLVGSVRWNAPAWILLAVGIIAAVRGGGARRDGATALRLQLVLAAPVALILIYRNYWPYAFVSLAPTLWIVAGAGWSALLGDGRRWVRWGAWVAVPWMVGALLPVARDLGTDGTSVQRQTLDVVHRLFPEPVPYLDRTGMVASFPRPLFNMTTFGMETYRAAGEASVSAYIDDHAPPLLLLNTTSLDVFPDGPFLPPDPRPALLPDDAAAVAETYTHFWGPLFLAGRSWSGLEAGREESFTIRVPGPFTLLADGPVEVDGVPVRPGGTVRLERGLHRIVSASGVSGEVRLVWGEGVTPPDGAPAPGLLLPGF